MVGLRSIRSEFAFRLKPCNYSRRRLVVKLRRAEFFLRILVTMLWFQRSIQLHARPRGFHLVTREIIQGMPELRQIQRGLLHVFIQHTSASLTINENADSDVRRDLESSLNAIVPEDFPYVHTLEGSDDMPAHVKASLLGSSVTIPIGNGEMRLGTWQGIYLCEHRDRGSPRNLILTLWGTADSGSLSTD